MKNNKSNNKLKQNVSKYKLQIKKYTNTLIIHIQIHIITVQIENYKIKTGKCTIYKWNISTMESFT